MHTKEEVMDLHRRLALENHELFNQGLSLFPPEEHVRIKELRTRHMEEWIEKNPEFFQHQADTWNALDAYNEALERGLEQPELDKLLQQAKDVAEASFNKEK
jgi:hypothetical protein